MSNLKETSNVRLLLVEDDVRYLTHLISQLNKFGYQHLTSADSAAQAKEQLSKHHFDVIVADMWMEREDSGFDVIDEVNKHALSSIVIILTGNESVDDCRQALKGKGAWDYIPKLIKGNSIRVLHQSIQEAITYFNRWGNSKDEKWVSENKTYLQDKYFGKYVAVLNHAVIESADTREELELRLQERKLPVFLTVIKKIESPLRENVFKKLTILMNGESIDVPLEGPFSAKLTIFVEGPTDVNYINKAAAMLGQEELLKSVHLDMIGEQTGQRGSGWKPMVQGFNFLQNNPALRPNKVLFLFDPDVRDKELANKGQDFENLFVRRICDKYSREKKGIEWLFDEQIFEEAFLKGFVEKDLGRATYDNLTPKPTYTYPAKSDIIRESDKTAFCQWLCNERENSRQDFEGFQQIFKIMAELLSA